MKPLCIISALALTGAVLLTGCGSHSTAAVTAAETETPQFSAKKGLLLPDQTRQTLGLKVIEVTEGKLDSAMDLQLRVYERHGATALASGTLTPDEAKQLKVEQAVDVFVKGGQSLPAKVTKVSEQLARETGSTEVLIEIPAAPEGIAIGTFVKATAHLASSDKVVTIPRSALLGCSEGQFVYTVSGDHYVRTAIKVGATNAESVEIADGLYAGDQVVLQPVMSLWMTELAAVKGGQSCCVEPPKGK